MTPTITSINDVLLRPILSDIFSVYFIEPLVDSETYIAIKTGERCPIDGNVINIYRNHGTLCERKMSCRQKR